MGLTASEAAREVGKSLPTITKAIKSGKLSASGPKGGPYSIEPAELFRVWPRVGGNLSETPKLRPEETPGNPSAGLEILSERARSPEVEQELRERLDDMREQLNDMRAQRDAWQAQAERAQISAPVPNAPPAEPKKPVASFWARLFR